MITSNNIDLTSFNRAVASLEAALLKAKDEFIRDSAIQRFEYTYELAVKMIARFIESTPQGANTDRLVYRDLIRVAAEVGLITDPEAWFKYRDARNLTSHAYDENKAEQVYLAAQKFLLAAQELLKELQQRL